MHTKKRRFFQFRLRTLLVGVALIAFAAAWWASWPKRTAQEFLRLIVDDFDAAMHMAGHSDLVDLITVDECKQLVLEMQPRPLSDVILGRQEFAIAFIAKRRDGVTQWREFFSAERGTIHGPHGMEILSRGPPRIISKAIDEYPAFAEVPELPQNFSPRRVNQNAPSGV